MVGIYNGVHSAVGYLTACTPSYAPVTDAEDDMFLVEYEVQLPRAGERWKPGNAQHWRARAAAPGPSPWKMSNAAGPATLTRARDWSRGGGICHGIR